MIFRIRKRRRNKHINQIQLQDEIESNQSWPAQKNPPVEDGEKMDVYGNQVINQQLYK